MLITKDGPVVVANKPNELITFAEGVRPTSILIKDSPGAILRGATFRNLVLSSSGSDAAFIKVERSPDVLITGCGIHNCNPANLTTEYKYVYVKHSPGVSIKQCTFEGKHNLGPALAFYVDEDTAADGGYEVVRCLFRDIRGMGAAASQNGTEAIRLYDSTRSMLSAHSLILDNWFEDCGSEGEPEIVSIKACDNLIHGNVLINCLGGLTSRHGKRNAFYDNYLRNCSIGIRIIDSDHKVVGNYIEGQKGTNGFKGAIVLVNGKPNSKLNEYFAADNAVVTDNILINNDRDVIITNGGKSELTIKPNNVRQVNNVSGEIREPSLKLSDVGNGSVYSEPEVPEEPEVPPTEPEEGETMAIWITTEEIKSLPTTGAAWNNVLGDANSSWGTADLSDNNSSHDVKTLAGALVAVRNDDTAMRNKVITGLKSAMASGFSRTLELSRGLQTYIIAADIIGYRDPAFLTWVEKAVNANIGGHSGGTGIKGTASNSANNWGGHARASLAAAAIFLDRQDWKDLVVTAHKAFIGVPAPGNTMRYDSTNWHAGTPQAGVNALNAGPQLSGVLPEDYRRGGERQWPPKETGYIGEGLQGFVVTAAILHRAGLVPFSAGDNAVVRALDAAFRAGSPPEGDDTWITWLVNSFAGTDFDTSPANEGKGMGYTDWTHATAVVVPPVEPEEPEEPEEPPVDPEEPEEPEEPPVEPEEPEEPTGPRLIITGDEATLEVLRQILTLLKNTSFTSIVIT